MTKHELTDKQWEKIKDMFPKNGNRGNQWKDHRVIVNGILWILRDGVRWRSLPEKYGPWKTVYRRFRLWTREGLWDKILKHLQKGALVERGGGALWGGLFGGVAILALALVWQVIYFLCGIGEKHS